jgi:hypothetical protein
VVLQIETSLTVDYVGIIYNCNIFIIQGIGRIKGPVFSWLNPDLKGCTHHDYTNIINANQPMKLITRTQYNDDKHENTGAQTTLSITTFSTMVLSTMTLCTSVKFAKII